MTIFRIEGTRILFETGPVTILHEGREATFVAGWQPVTAYCGLAPTTILIFESDRGESALWFLDGAMERRGGSLSELPDSMQIQIAEALCRLLDGIWQALILSRHPGSMTNDQRSFFELPSHLRSTLLHIYRRTFDSRPDYRTLQGVGNGASALPVLDSLTRRVMLAGAELHWLCDPAMLQRHFDTIPERGHMLLHSPCGGSLICCKSFLLETDLIAYRLYDDAHDLVAFILAGGIFNHTRALYFPESNIVVCVDPGGFQAFYPDLTGLFQTHIVEHGKVLFDYLNNDDAEPVHFWRGLNAIHLGHVLWNDYSGIERMLESGFAPRVLVCDANASPEMYGPLDEVFPELHGKVSRETGPLVSLTTALYRENALLFRTSAMKVTRALREKILAPIPVQPTDGPVLMLGLRTENRTATNLKEFCVALVSHLAAKQIPVTLVIDGHNSRPGGGNIMSHGEHAASRSPIAVERRLVEVAREAASGTAVTIVSTIGAPLSVSLAWARAANLLLAFWGAGLAKYRWVCNIPALVLTNHWNLENFPDLTLYNDPERMEEPTEVRFVSPAAVRDRPDAAVLIHHGGNLPPSLVNFDVDPSVVMRDLDDLSSYLGGVTAR